MKQLLQRLPKGFTVVCEDESIFIHDAIIRKVWAEKGRRPVCIVTGSHQRTCVFGATNIEGKQLFRQYDAFNEDTFLHYLKIIHRKFHKCYLFLDKAVQHRRSRKVLDYMEKHKDTLEVVWFPTASPEFNVMEECWRQTENDLLTSNHYSSFPNLKRAMTTYLRTRRFKLNMHKFLLTNRL